MSAKCLNINLIDDKKYKVESRPALTTALQAVFCQKRAQNAHLLPCFLLKKAMTFFRPFFDQLSTTQEDLEQALRVGSLCRFFQRVAW
ncbi:hypothetical protein Rin_00006160 [Candidatus Regiella insecticola 5.15]|uniref:Uncharacterized protein n=1 Tax=Candidatus Regiella insecticola 5.15 TaxID=1005043 RepID=G2GXX2_9ENTR|nr:hypothetical protein Rin_00006160 [Candidatus Regiella insecticola 5.15]